MSLSPELKTAAAAIGTRRVLIVAHQSNEHALTIKALREHQEYKPVPLKDCDCDAWHTPNSLPDFQNLKPRRGKHRGRNAGAFGKSTQRKQP